jgi:mono/diheme cytochrome c family protein
MIFARMSRPVRVLTISLASAAVAASLAACGTEKSHVPSSDPTVQHGAVLFSQRCAGCHTLSYSATHGSATNARTRQITDGPNFNVRCERPIDRVMYAIENGGFSGAIMPQNVVLGQDAVAVAKFVATFAGRQAPKLVGQQPCVTQPIGSLPPPTATTAGGSTSAGGSTTTTSASTSTGSSATTSSKTKKK